MGRGRHKPEIRKIRVTYNVPENLVDAIKQRADDEQWPLSMVVIEALKAYLNN